MTSPSKIRDYLVSQVNHGPGAKRRYPTVADLIARAALRRRDPAEFLDRLCSIPLTVRWDTRQAVRYVAEDLRRRASGLCEEGEVQTMHHNILQTNDGLWGANVWVGSHNPTNPQRYYYITRDKARRADISDVPGKRGCVRTGKYLELGETE